MKKKIVIVFSGSVLFILLLLLGLTMTFQDCFNCRSEIAKSGTYYKYSQPDDYEECCVAEMQQKIRFPLTEPAYAILHFDKLFKPSQRLTEEQTQTLLSVLNDTSSYVWGELGTPYFDRFVTFHDEDGRYIGITQIDFGGQTYSQPSIGKMKWGLLSDEGYKKLRTVVK